MTRCNQDHHDAGDQLNVNTRELLTGVDRAAKIIDDFLLMPKTLTDAYHDAALVSQAAIIKNFKFSREKFVTSPHATSPGSPCQQHLRGKGTGCMKKAQFDSCIDRDYAGGRQA